MTDAELYKMIANRDNKAFHYLYQKYYPMIDKMVLENSGQSTDTADLFQEGLVSLWSNIAQQKYQLQSGAKLSTYLFTLCRNQWISRLRKRRGNISLDASTLQIADEVKAEPDDRVLALRQYFAKLGSNCQSILKLFYFEKKSVREIAEALDLTEKTAKNNKYRCMQRLRKQYIDEL